MVAMGLPGVARTARGGEVGIASERGGRAEGGNPGGGRSSACATPAWSGGGISGSTACAARWSFQMSPPP